MFLASGRGQDYAPPQLSPLGIFKYLSSKEERVHVHRSLVLNLVCGALVAQVGA